jgi:hypothetical protein
MDEFLFVCQYKERSLREGFTCGKLQAINIDGRVSIMKKEEKTTED